MGIQSGILTAVEEWRLEGRFEGRVEGRMEAKLEIIENLLKLHMEWPLIEQVTGINYGRFQELKRLFKLIQLDQPQPGTTDQASTN